MPMSAEEGNGDARRCGPLGCDRCTSGAPDTRRHGFDEECRRQSPVVARADAEDRDQDAFLDALADLDEAAGA